MILNAYSIFDHKAIQYHPPFYASTDASAVRSLGDLVDDANTSVGRHPADYTLYLVGQWDDQSGGFAPCHPVMHVVDAISLVKPTYTAPVTAPVTLFKKEA